MRFGSHTQALTPFGPPPRRRRRRGPLLLLLLVPMLSGLFAAPAAGPVAGDELGDAKARQEALQKQIKAQKAQVAELNALQNDLKLEIASTSAALKGINADLDAVRASIGKMIKNIDRVKAKYAALVAEVAVLDEQLADLVAKEAVKRQELRDRKALLADRLRSAYETDRTSMLETFLSGGSFSDILAEVSYDLDVGEQDRALAERIVRDTETLAALHENVSATRMQTNLLKQQTAVQKKELDKQLVALKEAQAQLKALEIATAKALKIQQQAFKQLAANKKALQQSIRKSAQAQAQLAAKIRDIIARQASQGRIPSAYNGTLQWPMAGSVTQAYGCTGFSWEPPKGDCPHFHSGIDIAGPKYTPIKAAGPGTVVFAGPNPYDPFPKAWIVIIAHSSNLLTWYGHVDNAAKPPPVVSGQEVKAGEVIAYNGMTGRTTGPHLHWMVELDGNFVNPRLFL